MKITRQYFWDNKWCFVLNEHKWIPNNSEWRQRTREWCIHKPIQRIWMYIICAMDNTLAINQFEIIKQYVLSGIVAMWRWRPSYWSILKIASQSHTELVALFADIRQWSRSCRHELEQSTVRDSFNLSYVIVYLTRRWTAQLCKQVCIARYWSFQESLSHVLPYNLNISLHNKSYGV